MAREPDLFEFLESLDRGAPARGSRPPSGRQGPVSGAGGGVGARSRDVAEHLGFWDGLALDAATGGVVREDALAWFRAAGYDQATAERGVKLLESGDYIDAADVAVWALGLERYDQLSRTVNRGVSLASIEEASRQVPGAGVRSSSGGAGRRSLLERQQVTSSGLRVVESAAAVAVGEGLLEACVISAGEGSSAHYSAEVLEQAVADGVFAAGTHCYVDHPTEAEQFERPERSVRDLAGALEADGTFRDDAVWAKVRVYSSHRELLAERRDVIGMSIRADAEVTESASGGKPTATRITAVHSVDFVTKAGRGGRIVSWT